jgi:2-methylcitrate dehydratase PrpD
MISDLKQERDELAVQVHLGKKEVQQEWETLEEKFAELNHRYDPVKDAIGETGEEIWDALKSVGEELKEGFHRIRKSL